MSEYQSKPYNSKDLNPSLLGSACIIPALLAWKTRRKYSGDTGFKKPGGLAMIWLTITFGVITAFFHFLSMMGLLPMFSG